MQSRLAGKALVLSLCVLQFTACSIHRDEGLMDQIPNWEGEANKICGGQVRIEERTPEMTDRC